MKGKGEAGAIRRAFAARLRDWRKARRLPLKAVAWELGVSVSTLSSWETCERFPSPENLHVISVHTAIPICELVCVGARGCRAAAAETCSNSARRPAPRGRRD